MDLREGVERRRPSGALLAPERLELCELLAARGDDTERAVVPVMRARSPVKKSPCPATLRWTSQSNSSTSTTRRRRRSPSLFRRRSTASVANVLAWHLGTRARAARGARTERSPRAGRPRRSRSGPVEARVELWASTYATSRPGSAATTARRQVLEERVFPLRGSPMTAADWPMLAVTRERRWRPQSSRPMKRSTGKGLRWGALFGHRFLLLALPAGRFLSICFTSRTASSKSASTGDGQRRPLRREAIVLAAPPSRSRRRARPCPRGARISRSRQAEEAVELGHPVRPCAWACGAWPGTSAKSDSCPRCGSGPPAPGSAR